jgi:hypothetical protein
MALRILSFCVLLFSVLFMPFWATCILVLAAMLYFDLYWEAVLLFLLSDLLHGAGESRFFNSTYASFMASIVVLTAVEFIKKKSIFYPTKINR